MNSYIKNIFPAVLTLLLVSCGGNDKDKKVPVKDSSISTVRKEPVKDPDNKYQRPPIINIADTVSPKRILAYCSDSAATYERISLKLGKIYGSKLQEYIKKNNLKATGAPMAWYKKQSAGSGGKAPYFFEAAIPVNKKGAKPVTGVKVREMASGKVVIAHFYGPFHLLPQGYDVLKEWMKEHKKTAAGPPYEIYVSDTVDKNGKPLDPYKIQTDIVFPIR